MIMKAEQSLKRKFKKTDTYRFKKKHYNNKSIKYRNFHS